jgi:UPF0755 protein
MKRFPVFLLVTGLLIAATFGSAWHQYHDFKETPLAVPEGFVLDVPRGATMNGVLSRLEAAGVTDRDWRWRLFNRLNPVTIKAGEYRIDPDSSPRALLDMLAAGRVLTHAFTIVEGWSFSRLKTALADDPVLVHELADIGGDGALMERLGLQGMHPEGWFLPETYYFVRGDSDLDLLERAHTSLRDALDEAWSGRSDIPLQTPYELLILASIVEKETAVAAERAEVAGVFVRRLQQGWRLETDPTVIYGLGESFDGDIRTRDLRTDTPYNTYTRHGLPPTPISLPGRAALRATARPAFGTAMFFVADGQGGHVFSDTLEDHNAAVRKMLGRN